MRNPETNEFSLPDPVIAPRPRGISLIEQNGEIEATADHTYDLQALDEQRRVELRRLKQLIVDGHRDLTVLAVHSALRALRIGEYALKAKEILGHGQFHKWIEVELSPHSSLSIRTIQRYIKLARNSELLVQRIGKIYGGVEAEKPDFEKAQQILHGLKLEDALSILRLGAISSQKQGSPRELDVSPYRQAATRFFESANAPFQTHLSWQSGSTECTSKYQFIVPLDGKQNRQAVIESLEACGAGTMVEALLLLSGEGASHWLHLLDTFPRILIRHDESDGQRFLFGLIGRERFADFNDAFQLFGAVLVPFTA